MIDTTIIDREGYKIVIFLKTYTDEYSYSNAWLEHGQRKKYGASKNKASRLFRNYRPK